MLQLFKYNVRPCCNSANVAVEVTFAVVGVYNEPELLRSFLQLPYKNNVEIKKSGK